MNNNKLDEIKSKLNRLRVLGYKEEKVISDSKFLSIVKGTYTLNNNQTITREKVVKNIGSGDAVCTFAITKENKIILVIQPRPTLPTIDKANIELPAGYVNENEDSISAAKRELREETGYTSKNFILLDSYYPSQGASSEKIDLVLAINCEKKRQQNLDQDEFIECLEINFDEFEYLLNNNYILDANCRIGYYKVLEYIENTIFSDIVKTLINNNKTISTMESCTGGYLASSITNIENASKILKSSAVTYSNEAKIKMGVDQKIIEKYTVYSNECAREMAYNISKYTNSNYGIGITGTLKKYDENNKTIDNDKVYICIYDKDNNKYYDYKYQVTSNKRINNKRIIAMHTINNLKVILNIN